MLGHGLIARVVVDHIIGGCRLHAFGRIGRARIDQNYACNPATRQLFGRDKGELIFVKGQKLLHITVHLVRQHRHRGGEEQRGGEQRSQRVKVRMFMGKDHFKSLSTHAIVCRRQGLPLSHPHMVRCLCLVCALYALPIAPVKTCATCILKRGVEPQYPPWCERLPLRYGLAHAQHLMLPPCRRQIYASIRSTNQLAAWIEVSSSRYCCANLSRSFCNCATSTVATSLISLPRTR